jgi:hypothetical protein
VEVTGLYAADGGKNQVSISRSLAMSNHADTIHSFMRAEAYHARRHWERLYKELSDALDELDLLVQAEADERTLLIACKRIRALRAELDAAREEAVRAKKAELAADRQ